MLFRGFSNSLKSYDAELKSDKDKGFRVDKIIEQITHSINIQDLQGLRDIWSHLDGHLFSKLEHSFASAVKKLECGILKLYLVTAFTAYKLDKITEFFNKLAPELHAQSEWKDWFFFPFCKNPEENSVFAVCFTKQWQDTLLISLHNFLATIFQCMPQPTITRAEMEASLIKKLQEENSILRNRLLAISNQQQHLQQNASSSSHQSRLSSFHSQKSLDSKKQMRTPSNPRNLSEIVPFDIPPPAHIVDDFYIIAQETLNVGSMADSQARGLRSLIRNISSGGSPVLGRKESVERNKKRSGSVGSKSWNLH